VSASRVHRPTENAAIGRVRPPRLPSAALIRDSLAGAKHRADRYGTVLLAHMLLRATSLSEVGER
jgi:hypothetical protein